MAYVSAAINKLGENVTSKELQTELNNLVGQNKTNVSGGTILKVYFKDTEHEYKVKNGKVTKYEKMEPTAVYAKLYTDGTLILSSYDYTDETREIAENGNYGNVADNIEYEITSYTPLTYTGNYPGWMTGSGYPFNEKIKKVIVYDTIAPKTIKAWFGGCTELTEIVNLNNLNTSNVSDMGGTFWTCKKLEYLDLSNFDTKLNTNMYAMFHGCSTLTSLDLSSFDTSNVTELTFAFFGCSNLIDLNLSNFDTSKVIRLNQTFSNCSNLTSLDLSNFDTSKVTDMSAMFVNCSGLNTIYVSNKWSNESVTLGGAVFNGCTNLKGAISYDSSKIDVTYANYNTGYFTYKEETQ